MFCPKCGTTLADGAQFCGSCGAQLSTSAQVATSTAPFGVPAQQADAAPAYAPSAQQPFAGAELPTGANPYAGGFMGGAVAKKANKKPLVIAVAAIVVVAAIVGILYATGILGNGGIGKAVALNAENIISNDSKTASAELGKLVEIDLDGLGSIKGVDLYASSQDMADYVDGLYDDASSGKMGSVRSLDDVMSAAQAKKLNGQWVVAVLDNELLMSVSANTVYGITQNRDFAQSFAGIDGNSAVMVTVVADKDLTSEELANVISSAGVKYDHVIADSESLEGIASYIENMSAIASLSLMKSLESVGLEGVGVVLFWGENQLGFAVSVQSEEYAVVALYVANCADFGISPEMTKGIYIK